MAPHLAALEHVREVARLCRGEAAARSEGDIDGGRELRARQYVVVGEYLAPVLPELGARLDREAESNVWRTVGRLLLAYLSAESGRDHQRYDQRHTFGGAGPPGRTHDLDRVAGKLAMISGAARGIRAEAARFLLAEGGEVAIGDALDAQGEALAAEFGEPALYAHLSVTDRAGGGPRPTSRRGRSGRTPENANLIVYLASDESTFSTGAGLVADGGALAGLPA